MKKHILILLVILIIAAIFRFWQLGVVPSGVTHDELGYIYNAYSIAKTSRNVFGELLPFLTWLNQGGWPFLPIPIYLSVLFFFLFDLSATVGRLPSALLGVFDILLVYILVKQIFNKNSLALLSSLFLAISPWHLHFSRSAYDPNFALFFYLLGILLFINSVKNGKLPVLAIVCFLLAIFSYRGMNALFPALVITLLWYGIKILHMNKRQVLSFLIGVFLIFFFLSIVAIQSGSRYAAEVSLVLNNPKMQEEIDTQIREAKGPLFVRRLFLNKPTYIINKFRENYIRSYSPEFLFLYTEPSKIYSIWSRGRIYFLDLIFIILGVVYLYKINKNGATFFVLLALISGLPGMAGGLPYSARNFFLSAILPVLSAGGILFLLHSCFLKQLKTITMAVLIISYAYAFGSYIFDYYGRYALYGAEAWAKSLKDVSILITRNQQKYDNIIVGTASFGDLMQYAFYSRLNPLEVQKAWQQRKKEGIESYSINNVTFAKGCLDDGRGNLPLLEKLKPILYIVHEECNKFATPSGLIKDYPGNTVWKIYNIK